MASFVLAVVALLLPSLCHRAMICGLRLALILGLQWVVAGGDDLILIQLLRGEEKIHIMMQEGYCYDAS